MDFTCNYNDNFSTKSLLWITVLIVIQLIVPGLSTCYFPIEYQGIFQTQASASSPGYEVTYSEITIDSDAIPPWGRCHKRRGNNVILKDTTGVEDCMRCFHLTLKTSNVIQIYTEGLAKCYTNEEAARATCPTERNLREKKFKEIILFRKHVPEEYGSTENVFCPINGRFKFTYTADNGQAQCDQAFSDLSNCPRGNELGVRFKKCAFLDQEIQFQCFGDWENPNGGDRYLALMDLSPEPKNRPKYRCGMYHENSTTGQVYVSLSADSTCSTNLINARNGYESLTLTPIATKASLPVQYESVKCRFPDWTQGKWDRTRIEGNIFKFKDVENNYRTLTSKCIMRQSNTPDDRFIIHSTTQCGEQFYTCVWMKRRSTNILEFQFSAKTSPNFSGHLCDSHHFNSQNWTTQGRKTVVYATPCPITGDYIGIVPNVTGLCTKVASDCNNPDIMFYTVSSCENRSHIYEEREYRCLGNWEEDGVLYTYTKRRDAMGYQCFAGKILGNGEVAYIREAGDNCVRGEDPMIDGMKITKQVACPRLSQVTSYVPMRPTWQSRADKILHKAQQPSFPPPMRTLATKPVSQSLPHHIPQPRLTMIGQNDKNPHWYQADPPARKIWKPASIPPFKPSEMKRNSSSSLNPLVGLLIILISLASRLM